MNILLKSVRKTLREAQILIDRTNFSLAAILMLAALSDGNEHRVGALAEAAGVTQQAVGKKLALFNRRGLIKMRVDPEDHRAMLSKLTPDGKRAVTQIQEAWK